MTGQEAVSHRMRRNGRVLATFQEAADHLSGLLPSLGACGCGVILVGLGGPTAVGKSTLARMFQTAAKVAGAYACVLEGDRFLVPQERRAAGARFPEGIYEVASLMRAVATLKAGRPFRAPFYEKDGRVTGRISVAGGYRQAPPEVVERCRPRQARVSSRLVVDDRTGDVLEAVVPEGEVWIFDSELALFYPALRDCYDVSYGLRASRDIRRRNFLNAVARGERYALLTPTEASAKIEGFWDTDDALIEPTVDRADYVVALNE